MGTPRRALFGKLNLSLFRAIESATGFAKLRGNPYVELVHWLHQLWQVSANDFQRIASHYGIDAAQLEKDFAVALSQLPSGASGLNDFSHHIELAIERAWIFTSLTINQRQIRGAWLLAAVLQTPELRRVALGISASFQKIPLATLETELPAVVIGSSEQGEGAHDASDLPDSIPGEDSHAGLGGGEPESSALTKYCADLTAQAREGRIDPVIGREHEIRTMVDILLRRRQNNPLLTGEAGVGKTAVVEGLALAIVAQTVPPSLHQVRLLSLDVGALLAGASMRGEFEQRLKSVLKEVAAAAEPVILFIDEVHTLVGAGGQTGTGDAANLLKPALARGNLRAIGATTWSEYKKHIEKDPALTRRFQVLQVMEPEEAQAVSMVRGLVPTFIRHHAVTILDEAVRAAVMLSHRYIPSRQLPDKAISLLDTACARVAISLHAPPAQIQTLTQQLSSLKEEAAMLSHEVNLGKDRTVNLARVNTEMQALAQTLSQRQTHWLEEQALCQKIIAIQIQIADVLLEDASTKNTLTAQRTALELSLSQLQVDRAQVHLQVDEAIVAAIVADWTGIPVGLMATDDVLAVLDLQNQLQQRVIGQPTAIAQISERLKSSKAKLTDPHKPLGVFMLVGTSGVGKTETALALAEAMYGGEHNLITINMSEYQEAHTVSSLKGSPPGYVGYGEGGVLTEAVRRRPYSVILLDEVEKAHPDVHEIFYQVFDKGSMEDGEGRVIDFKNTLILLTSNAGSELIDHLCEDPALMPNTEALSKALQPELRKTFPAAFLGRLSIVPYFPLGIDVLKSIVQLQLNKVVKRMYSEHGINLHCTPAVMTHIVTQCGTHETGARRLGQFIEQNLLPMLAHVWLQAMQEKLILKHITVDTQAAPVSHTEVPRSLQLAPQAGLHLHVALENN